MSLPSQSLGANHPIRSRLNDLTANIGRAALNNLFPNDFEYYACSLELVNSKGQTVDFFTLPVMPSNISQAETSLDNIKKTTGGIVSLSTSTFEPIDIQLSGNFGRRLKLLIGMDHLDFSTLDFSFRNGIADQYQSGVKLKKPNLQVRLKQDMVALKYYNTFIDQRDR